MASSSGSQTDSGVRLNSTTVSSHEPPPTDPPLPIPLPYASAPPMTNLHPMTTRSKNNIHKPKLPPDFLIKHPIPKALLAAIQTPETEPTCYTEAVKNHASVPTTSSAPIYKAPDPTPCIITPNDPEQVKLFFERFPSLVEYQDLKRAFCKLGRVNKLFISTRKTDLGRRFGFVDILSPVPVSDLCVQANTI
ncbi:hypothetical protein POTOM_058889 [Populus tomentosa]|uniref:RRM domain-containing protein n=1 Tax=Populus tomentosa TaxID=118781 RepID=A0A8X7XVY2_POPTO|nr:hypothetical protein POTOM_058889 [Populus tomentosa]